MPWLKNKLKRRLGKKKHIQEASMSSLSIKLLWLREIYKQVDAVEASEFDKI